MARCAGYGLEVEGMWFVVALIGLVYYGIRIFIEQWKMLESSTVDFYKTKARLDAYTEKCERERQGK